MKRNIQDLLSFYSRLPESFDGWPSAVNQRSLAGDHPINVAAQRGEVEEIGLLLRHGACINQPGEHGYRPIHNAIERGHLYAVEFLLSHGAQVNALTDDLVSPTELAEVLGEVEISKALTKYSKPKS